MISRIYYNLKIQNDEEIQGALVKNGSLCDQLGRIDIILSDKTGTLTKNTMLLKKVSFFIKSTLL